MPEGPSEKQLVAAIAEGDLVAFDGLYRAYRSRVFNFFYRRLCDREQAEDQCQELFIKVIENAHRFDPTYEVEQWIIVMASNMCKNIYKRQGIVARVIEKAGEVDWTRGGLDWVMERVESTVLAQIDAERVRKAIAKLPHIYREVIVMKEYEGASYKDIAERYGCPESTVRRRMHDGLKHLKGALLTAQIGEL